MGPHRSLGDKRAPGAGTRGPWVRPRHWSLVSGVRLWWACPLALSLLAFLPSLPPLASRDALGAGRAADELREQDGTLFFTECPVSGSEAMFPASAQSTCAFGKWTQP